MKLKALQSIHIAPRKRVSNGEEFEIEDKDEAARLVDIGAAEQIMIPSKESELPAKSEATKDEKPSPSANRPQMTRPR